VILRHSKERGKAFARMFRVPQHDTPRAIVAANLIQHDVWFYHPTGSNFDKAIFDLFFGQNRSFAALNDFFAPVILNYCFKVINRSKIL
jgi:hypothetical protein